MFKPNQTLLGGVQIFSGVPDWLIDYLFDWLISGWLIDWLIETLLQPINQCYLKVALLFYIFHMYDYKEQLTLFGVLVKFMCKFTVHNKIIKFYKWNEQEFFFVVLFFNEQLLIVVTSTKFKN